MSTQKNTNDSIVHVSIADMVAEKLKSCILDGTFQNGQKLVGAELCRQMEVSRTSVNKAFRMLEEEGLLRYIRGQGVIVEHKGLPRRNYHWEVLSALYWVAKEKALEYISPEQLWELKAIFERMQMLQSLPPGGDRGLPQQYAGLDRLFHKVLLEACGNPLLEEYAQAMAAEEEITQYFGQLLEGGMQEYLHSKQALLWELEREVKAR